MFELSHDHVQGALRHADLAQSAVAQDGVADAAAAAASAVNGGELAAALTEVGPRLDSRVRALRHAIEGWASEVNAAVAAYDNTDHDSVATLRRYSPEAV